MFIISGLGYNLFVGFGFLIVHCNPDEAKSDRPFFCDGGFVYPVIIVCSMICGVCAGMIWVAQGGYIEILGRKVNSNSSL